MAYMKQALRELRTPLTGTCTYASGCGEAGRAQWLNISRTGAALRLGRYLRPGHVIQLLLDAGDRVILARIAWCVPIAGTLHFQAGLVAQPIGPESTLSFATLVHEAQTSNKNTEASVLSAMRPHYDPAALPTRLNTLIRGGGATARTGNYATGVQSSRLS
jgi:hypothetical protein